MTLSPRLGRTISLALCLAGAALSGSLWTLHAAGQGSPLLSAVCGGVGSGCDKVTSSRWAVFPPEDPPTAESPSRTRGGIPVAALGLFYFSVLAVGIATLGVPTRPRRAWMVFCAVGATMSVGFLVLMAAVVKAWCPLCLGSHACNLLLLGQLAFLTAPSDAPSPTRRLVLTAAALAIAVVAAEAYAFKALRLESELSQIAGEFRKYSQDAHAQELKYMQAKQVEIRIREDDPIIQAIPGVRNTIVLFSDIECPHCARFDRFLFQEIKPLYQGRLRIVFKHFPLDKLHPNARRGAAALEAARLQGKFWEMRDLLLENRQRLASVDYPALAKAVGMDPDKFVRDMESDAVRQRIQEDAGQAERLGLHSTPEVFLNSRQIDRVSRDLLGFWKLRAEAITKAEIKK